MCGVRRYNRFILSEKLFAWFFASKMTVEEIRGNTLLFFSLFLFLALPRVCDSPTKSFPILKVFRQVILRVIWSSEGLKENAQISENHAFKLSFSFLAFLICLCHCSFISFSLLTFLYCYYFSLLLLIFFLVFCNASSR